MDAILSLPILDFDITTKHRICFKIITDGKSNCKFILLALRFITNIYYFFNDYTIAEAEEF
jgi:hypothetical protein